MKWFDQKGVEHAIADTDQGVVVREDGRIERLCRHGIGHPIGHRTVWQSWMGVHGCDGCCYHDPCPVCGRPFWAGHKKRCEFVGGAQTIDPQRAWLEALPARLKEIALELELHGENLHIRRQSEQLLRVIADEVARWLK